MAKKISSAYDQIVHTAAKKTLMVSDLHFNALYFVDEMVIAPGSDHFINPVARET